MKVLRIVLTQSSANYKKEETIDNKMTYPLPPISTIIGAIHNACGYKDYHSMDISVQGKFESMHKEPYTDYCFLNSVMDDRGILLKMRNGSLLSNAFDKVASAKKSQGNSFRKGITIQVYNEELLKEYRDLKDLNDKIAHYKKNEFKEKLDSIKAEKTKLAEDKKKLDKKSKEFEDIVKKEKEVKLKEKEFKEKVKEFELEKYIKPISKFRSLTTSLKYYEILNNVELVIHVRSDEKTLNEIEENIYNLKSIGRSEDFVNIIEAKIVTLKENDDCEIRSNYSAYLNYNDVKNKKVWFENVRADQEVSGTKYYINKNYIIKDGKRFFEKKKVIYASQYSIEETSKNIFIDNEDNKEYIVNFI
ncbi:CRISPR-associated protein Cas5 [Clostridium tetani]|uniref:CRISPR-associated protein Cas5 n=1 Tax=Clostridium tetani TaxID=1513 RepID=A0A4Q0VDF7_CLOTA|nr:CRISPR-associated protein Cas5 [Clostridium tetani]RXI49230.1 CRISPR-associated protein Cas5 [Clostridium tetani]CDI49496.1 CRISPR-associated protein, Cas5t family [Clostridium tetani 12124569]